MSYNQSLLERGEQIRLQKAIGQRVYVIENKAVLRPELFSAIHRDIKDHFGVESYKFLRRDELQSTIHFIESWKPNKKATQQSGPV